MLGMKKSLRHGQLHEFDRRGPVLVEADELPGDLPLLAEDYRAFGGTLRALLIPRDRHRIEVEVEYAAWRMVVGQLPEPVTRDFYPLLRRMERHGDVAMCVATIEGGSSAKGSRSSEPYQVWLNPAA